MNLQRTCNETGTVLMRYLIQLLIPALIVIAVVYVVLRNRQNRSDPLPATKAETDPDDGDKRMVVVILVVGAIVAIGVMVAVQGLWDGAP
jgi:Na+/H+ antiporter NhaD/arsenite permease-like protein